MKRIIAVILCVAMAVCVGCSARNGDNVQQNEIQIEDQAGRIVTIPNNINKVISCYYTATSTLLALGQKDKLVGIEMNAKTRELYKRVAPELLDMTAVGNSKTINVETCASFGANLVIIPDRLTDMIDKLETAGMTVVVVSPENEDDIMEMFEIFGKIFGNDAKQKSQQLVSYYNEKINFVKSLKFKDNKPNVYTTGNSSYLTTATKEMFQTSLIETSGGKSVASDLEGNYWLSVTAEQLALWNPDFIFMPNGKSFSTDQITSDAGLKNISAIKNSNVYEFPSTIESWDYPTPSVILGILWATNKLHPELYSKEKMIEDGKYFYKTFYNIDVTNKELGYEG